jgi:signal peptidase
MKTFKKIASITLDIVIVLVFIVSVLLVVANLTADKEKGEQANVFGYVVNSVQSESMSGTFEKGSLVIGKLVDGDTVIEKDDIVSYYTKINGVETTKTHRVVEIKEVGEVTMYQTWGDNRDMCPTPDRDPEWKTMGDIQSVYQMHIPLLGGFIDFLKEPLGFIICLVLPMLAFIGWQIYKLIAIYLQTKKEQMLEEAKEGVSEEAKDAIIREYLAKMQAEGEAKAEHAEPTAPVNDEINAESGDDNT